MLVLDRSPLGPPGIKKTTKRTAYSNDDTWALLGNANKRRETNRWTNKQAGSESEREGGGGAETETDKQTDRRQSNT